MAGYYIRAVMEKKLELVAKTLEQVNAEIEKNTSLRVENGKVAVYRHGRMSKNIQLAYINKEWVVMSHHDDPEMALFYKNLEPLILKLANAQFKNGFNYDEYLRSQINSLKIQSL